MKVQTTNTVSFFVNFKLLSMKYVSFSIKTLHGLVYCSKYTAVRCTCDCVLLMHEILNTVDVTVTIKIA